MLLFYILMLLILGCHIHGGVIQDHDNDIENKPFSKKAKMFFQRRCWNNKEQLQHITRERNNIEECIKNILPIHTEEKQCFETRKGLMECVQKVVHFLEPCLPPEENYLPDFITKSFGGLSEYLCKHMHVLSIDGLMEINMAKCINRFTRYKNDNPNYICYEGVKFGNHSHDAPILKEELCEDLEYIYNCYERQLKNHCPDAPKGWEFLAGLLNAWRSQCNEKDEEVKSKQGTSEKGNKYER